MLSKIPERSENGRSNDPATSEGTSTGTILWELALLLLLLIGAAFVIKQQVRLQHIREEVDELKKDYKGMQEGRSTLEERLQAVPKLQKWAACMEERDHDRASLSRFNWITLECTKEPKEHRQ